MAVDVVDFEMLASVQEFYFFHIFMLHFLALAIYIYVCICFAYSALFYHPFLRNCSCRID